MKFNQIKIKTKLFISYLAISFLFIIFFILVLNKLYINSQAFDNAFQSIKLSQSLNTEVNEIQNILIKDDFDSLIERNVIIEKITVINDIVNKLVFLNVLEDEDKLRARSLLRDLSKFSVSILETNELLKINQNDYTLLQKRDSLFKIYNIYIQEAQSLVNKTYLLADISFNTILIINQKIYGLFAILLIVIILIIIFLSFWFSRSIIKPLIRLKEAIIQANEGNFDKKLNLETNDEISEIFAAFQSLIIKLSKVPAMLTKEINEKTLEIRNTVDNIKKQNEYLQNTRKAIINLLEDLNEDRKKIETEQFLVLTEISNTKKFKEAVNSSIEAVLITDLKSNIIYVNKAWERLTGYIFSEVEGKNPRILHSGKTPKTLYKEMWKILLKGESFISEEVVNRRKDGSEYEARLLINSVKEKNVIKYYVGTQIDITERKLVDRAKTEFISVASHQLRTPLSAMKWLVELLLDDDVNNLTDKQKEYLKELETSTKRLAKLVNDLLNVSRIESGRVSIDPKKTDLSLLIKDVIKEFKPLSEAKNCIINMEYNTKLNYMLRIDNTLIRQVITNLISNALKYSTTKCFVKVNLNKNDKEFKVSVSDTGIGIPKKDQLKIFEKFFRADNAKLKEAEGSGLGLRIAKMAVEASGGKMWFESLLNKGTTFYFTLPVKGSDKKLGEVNLS